MAGVGRLVGATGKWTKQALLAFLEDLRKPKLSDLDEREQYEILQQGGQMPALRAVLGGASPMAVLRDLSGGGAPHTETVRPSVYRRAAPAVGPKAHGVTRSGRVRRVSAHRGDRTTVRLHLLRRREALGSVN